MCVPRERSGMQEEPRDAEAIDEYESEIGATSGRTHEQVLEQTIGRERALRAVTEGGPDVQPEQRKRDPSPALEENE